MEMSDIKEIRIFTGPGDLAYDFDNGKLTVWVGDLVKLATSEAQRFEIVDGCLSWSMEEK